MKPQSSHLLTALIQGAGSALGVQIASVGIVYTSQILLVRWMGVVEYGIYDFTIVFSLFLSFVAGLGLPTAVLRFISEYRVKQDWAHLQGMMRGSWRQTLGVSLITATLSTAVLLQLSAHYDLKYVTSLV